MLGALAAAAQEPAARDPYRLGVGVEQGFDSNLLRLPASVSPQSVGASKRPRGTAFTRGFLTADVDAPISRQHLIARANVSRTMFSEYGYLDHVAIDSEVGMRWELGNFLSGNIAYLYNRSLAGFADFRANERNLRTTNTMLGNLEYAFHPRWRAYTGVRGLTAQSTAEALKQSDLRQVTGEAGVTYRASGDNFVRFVAGVTRGDYPNRTDVALFDNRFNQNDYAIETRWALSSASFVRGRVAYTTRRYPNVPARDFSGPTGDLALNWGLTGKTGLVLGARREIGIFEDIDASYTVTDVYSIAPYWDITPKLRLDTAYERWTRRYPGDPQFVASGLPQRRDDLDFVKVGARWEPARALALRMGYQWSTRTVNRPDLDFRDNLVFVSGEARF